MIQRDGASDNEERGQGKTDILRRYGLLGDDDSHGSSRHGGYKSKYVRDLLQEQESMMRPQTATRYGPLAEFYLLKVDPNEEQNVIYRTCTDY